ncbi:hypothetical protein RJT34_12462 [Clitoria ternatea]|uniref:Uncharacterized protein n=1 Tax=Clitoria ternatea TaxID=43366 RepID=A0AAN9PJC6_CLITE
MYLLNIVDLEFFIESPTLIELMITINELSGLSHEELEIIRKLHLSDTSIDKEKNSIELKLCVERNIPYLGICRRSQILYVSCGGTLYPDVKKELLGKCPEFQGVVHINYENYDGHHHLIKLVANTPLHNWFKDSLEDEKMEIMVNSYHDQGVKILAQRFVPIAFAPDGLEFVKAVIEYEKRLSSSTFVPRPTKLSEQLELKGKENVALSLQKENRLKQVGATIRNGSIYIHKLQMNQMREKVARTMMANMSIEQLSDMMSFHGLICQICSDTLERKMHELYHEEG